MPGRKTALIAGATGIIGNRLANHLAGTGAWNVIGLSRRPQPQVANIRYICMDLSDAVACRVSMTEASDTTHLFYCARGDALRSGEMEPFEANVDMFINLLEAASATAPDLVHVHALQGTKYYGSNLGPFRTPAKEDDARGPGRNFYYAQQDLLVERSAGADWTWSISRPAGICDPSPNHSRSIAYLIGVYATVLRELGEPLHFPGSRANYDSLYQFTDARLLSRGIEWIATAPQCSGQAFNLTNGDYFRWRNLWPRIADYFGMEVGEPTNVKLAQTMPDKGDIWLKALVRAGLEKRDYDGLVLWSYGDYVFGTAYDVMSDTTKIRRAGFNECLDTEEAFFELFDQFRRQGVLP